MYFYDRRKDLVLDLIRKEFGRGKGAYAAFADDSGIAATTVSRWFMNGEGRRNIGEEVARRIENKYRLSPGSLVFPESGRDIKSSRHGDPWPFPITLEEWEGIDATGKAAVRQMMRALVPQKESSGPGRHKKSDEE